MSAMTIILKSDKETYNFYYGVDNHSSLIFFWDKETYNFYYGVDSTEDCCTSMIKKPIISTMV